MTLHFAARTLVVGLLAIAPVGQVRGELIELRCSGEVLHISPVGGSFGPAQPPGAVQPGNPVRVRFVYDGATTASHQAQALAAYLPSGPGTTFTVEIGGLRWSTSAPSLSILSNAFLNEKHVSMILIDQTGPGDSFPAGSFPGAAKLQSSLIISATTSEPNRMLGSVALPRSIKDIRLGEADTLIGTIIAATDGEPPTQTGWTVQYLIDPGKIELRPLVSSTFQPTR